MDMGIKKALDVDDDGDKQAILNWLSPLDFTTQQIEFLERSQSGDGEWFLQSAEYRAWLEKDGQVLFCPGIPKAGKTVLTAIVIDKLMKMFPNRQTTGIAYIYCNSHLRDTNDLIASLLKQLSQSRSSLTKDVKDIYRRASRGPRRPLRGVSSALESVTEMYSRVFIIVDALDECQLFDSLRFLSELFDLQESNTNILVTSRFIPGIVAQFEGVPTLEIRASSEDIARYLDDMDELPSFVRRDKHLQTEIRTKIVEAADGVFLLARLYFELLMGEEISRTDIRRSLQNLLTRSEILPQAYEETMQRIEVQRTRELAHRVLAWISYAVRPLRTSELQEVLAMDADFQEVLATDEDADSFLRRSITMVDYMVSACKGLVMIDPISKTLRFAHHTIHEYLKGTQKDWLTNAKDDITKICVTYLLSDTFGAGFCGTDAEFETRLQQHPFYDYAARYWDDHYRAASADVDRPILALLENGAKVSALYQAMKASGSDPGYSQKMPRDITGLSLAAQLGLPRMTMMLLENQHDPNSMDSDYRTPLWLAIERQNEGGQNEEVIKLLAKGDRKTFRMMMLKKKGNMTRSLLNIACKDIKDFRQRTPIHMAVELDDLDTAKEAISLGVNIDAKDGDGITSLLLAVRLKKKVFVDLLLENGADAKGVKGEGWIKVYKIPESDIVQLSESRMGRKSKSVRYFRPEDLLVLPQMQSDTERRLFMFNLPQWKLPAELIIPQKGLNQLIHCPATILDGQNMCHFVAVSFPALLDPVKANAKSFVETLYGREEICIMWTMRCFPDSGGESWISTDHYSTLPNGWIPDGGTDFFRLFILHLKQQWLKLCNIGDTYLTESRRKVLLTNGTDFDLISRLLEDAQLWIELRTSMQQHLSEARSFQTYFSRYINESKALEELTETINHVEDVITDRFTKLDHESGSLISIVFNLTSIAQAQNEIKNSDQHAKRQNELSNNLLNLTTLLAQDSSNMKVIAILTALFLPGTFMAILLTTPMFKWPDPPDGQIIVRLPFEIYWATSLSVTIILGFSILIWAILTKPDDWPKTKKAISRLGAGKLFAQVAKKRPGSDHKQPDQGFPTKEDVATIESSRDTPLATNSQLAPALGQIMADQPRQTTEVKKGSASDLEAQEAAVASANTVNLNARLSKCAVM